MIKHFFIGLILISFSFLTFSQSYELQGYSIGSDAPTNAFVTEPMMPEVTKIGSVYYMYFASWPSTGQSTIQYATSPDLLNWTVQDTILISDTDSTSREFVIGGPRVIELPSGGFRMFYRCFEAHAQNEQPPIHLRSAFSNDGVNFTKEGIVIDITKHDNTSYFNIVGHSEFYYDAGGNLRAFLTGQDTTYTDPTSPDRLYLASSSDGGLSWSDFIPLYEDCHDPVIVIDSTGTYHAFFSYLAEGFKTATSTNGVVWPNEYEDIFLVSEGDTITEDSAPKKAADLGASVLPNGEIHLYSNYRYEAGPWSNIAYYKVEEIPTSVINVNHFNLFPNPATDRLNVPEALMGSEYTILDITGRILENGKVTSQVIDVSNLKEGTYLLRTNQKEYASAIFYLSK